MVVQWLAHLFASPVVLCWIPFKAGILFNDLDYQVNAAKMATRKCLRETRQLSWYWPHHPLSANWSRNMGLALYTQYSSCHEQGSFIFPTCNTNTENVFMLASHSLSKQNRKQELRYGRAHYARNEGELPCDIKQFYLTEPILLCSHYYLLILVCCSCQNYPPGWWLHHGAGKASPSHFWPHLLLMVVLTKCLKQMGNGRVMT